KTIELINEQLKINSKALASAAIAYFTGGASASAGVHQFQQLQISLRDKILTSLRNFFMRGIPSPLFPHQIRLSATSSLNLSFDTPQQVAGKTSLPEGVMIGYTFLELP
ncbi:25905_t:CDS:2, partial [Gigaspora rosea]